MLRKLAKRLRSHVLENRYKEIWVFFTRLGIFGFGGPLALVSSMHKYCVEEKHWISHREFNATFSLIKALPGPIAFMMTVTLGRIRGGFWGGLLAGIALNLPAFCLMILFSLFFSSISDLSFVHLLMIGMQVAALGVILGSLKGLVKGNETNYFFWFLVVLSGIINFYGPATEPIFIFLFGLILIMLRKYERSKHSLNELGTLAFVCFKAGSLVFGSGLAIVPMLQHDVVDKYKWLTQSEFLDALAFGQMTPGPVVITATYIGHRMHGMPGAVVATVAMFVMAFIHMNTWFPHVMKKLHDRAWINDFLFGALAAVVGPIIVAVIRLGMGISLTPFLYVLAFASFIATLQGKIPLWLIIPFGGVLSLMASYVL